MSKYNDNAEEYEDPDEILTKKVAQLAKLVKQSRSTVIYTGAGISTSADIPDYRGPQGVWTLAFQNKSIDKKVDMRKANPTFTHMFIKELFVRGKVSHILSQNCDGLHLRSGLPQSCLSEVHGNMYVEVCTKCKPQRQFIRSFDCTKNSAFKKHLTGRNCDVCQTPLQDTIVHFGEIGKSEWPQNWKGIHDALENVDLIICVGSSLNVLKHYKFLWPEPGDKTKLVIINLQWTAKDKIATLKVNAQCDLVMRKLQDALGFITLPYCRSCDPVLNIETKTTDLMMDSTDCTCGNPCLSSPSTSEAAIEEEHNQPGWWAAEINRMKATAPATKSPSSQDNVHQLRKRKKTGRKRKPKVETDLEKDIRLTLLDLVNSVAGDDDNLTASKRRGRGRPKKYYRMSIEKEGSFKITGSEEEEPKALKDDRPPDFDFDADEGAGSESDTSHEGDPSFKIPKQMLANTFWSGPARKKRGKPGEKETEWNLLPKRTRKVARRQTDESDPPDEAFALETGENYALDDYQIDTSFNLEENPDEPYIHDGSVSFNLIATDDVSSPTSGANSEVEVELFRNEIEVKEEVVVKEEEIDIVDEIQVKTEVLDEEPEDDDDDELLEEDFGPMEAMQHLNEHNFGSMQDMQHQNGHDYDVMQGTQNHNTHEMNHFDEILEEVAAARPRTPPYIKNPLINTSPLMLDNFPPGCNVVIKLNGFSCKDRSATVGSVFVLPVEIAKKLRVAAFASPVLLTGVARFMEENKHNPCLSSFSMNEVMDLARRLRDCKPNLHSHDSLTISLDRGYLRPR